MKILKQEPKESYRAKKIKRFLDEYFPIKEITIPTGRDLKLAVLKQVTSEKGKVC